MSNQYDADAPEGSQGLGNQYISKKDIILVAIVLAVAGAVGYFTFPDIRKNADEATCKKNLKNIADSIRQYAIIYDDRYPPLYNVGPGGAPAITDGYATAWASPIPPLAGGASFTCPAAHEHETIKVNGESTQQAMFEKDTKQLRYIKLSYGMLASLSTRPVYDVANPNQTILIAETSNNGSKNTYNPMPFTDNEGKVVPYDGFGIGFDDTNGPSTPSSKFVTRLSFFGTKNGDFSAKSITSRHKKGLVFSVTAEGNLRKLAAQDAKLSLTDYTWQVR